MRLRKLLPAIAVASVLGGCAVYPYDNPNYYGSYGSGYYTGPGYYSGPSVGFGITYSDRRDHWRDDRWRDDDDHRHRHWDRDR